MSVALHVVQPSLVAIFEHWSFVVVRELTHAVMIREEKLRATDMGNFFCIVPDGSSHNYDKFYVEGNVLIESDKAYTSHNTNLLDVDGVVKKIMITD